MAIGSGSDVASGALYATQEKNPFERVVTAIDAAAESTLFVDNGIDMLVTDDRKDDNRHLAKALGFELNELKAEISEAENEAKKPAKKSSKSKTKNK